MLASTPGSPAAVNGVETTEGGHASPSPPEDGHPAAADTLDNGIVSPEESTTGLVAAVKATNDTPDIWKTRLWFVRYPPPSVEKQEGFGDLEAKLESFKQQVRLLNASADVKRLERDSVQQLRKQAQSELRGCRERWQAKEEQLKPLREARDAQRQSQTGLRTAGNELSVRSQAELEGRIRELHHQQQHSSLSVNEEKRLLQQIKLLEGQRGKVKEFEQKMQASQAARETSQQMQGDFKALEQDSRALREERNLQQAIFEKYRDQQADLDAQINSIFEERTRVKGLQDDAYGELKDARRDQKQKHGPYSANRWFSQQVRRVLRAGDLEEARQMCHQQMEENLQRLEEDADFRGEYLAMWAQSRPKPDASSGDQPSSRPNVDEKAEREASRARAEQMIAQALEQAKSSLAQSRSSGMLADTPPGAEPADGPADASAPAPGMPLPSRPPPPKPTPAPPKAPQAPPKAPQVLPRSAPPAPPTNGAAAKPASKAPSVPDAPFEVPAHLLANAEPPSEEELRAKLREHNAAAVRDAEARKERQRKQAEKKKAKVARQKAERKAGKQQPHLAQAGKTDTEDSATADGATTGVEGDSDTPSLGVPAVPSTDFLLSAETEANAVAKRRPKQPKSFQMDPVPLRRRPPRRKGVVKVLYDNQVALAVGGGAVVAALTAYLWAFGLPFSQS